MGSWASGVPDRAPRLLSALYRSQHGLDHFAATDLAETVPVYLLATVVQFEPLCRFLPELTELSHACRNRSPNSLTLRGCA